MRGVWTARAPCWWWTTTATCGRSSPSCSTRAGLQRQPGAERPRGAEAPLRRAARPRPARHLDAGARRLGDARADPRAERRARADAERARRRAREGARAARGRRRLRDQAVRAPGAARARREPAAPGAERPRCATPTATRCSRSTSRSAACGPATEPIELTPLEFRLLTAFVDNPGQLLAHDQLLELAWGGERGTSRDQVKLYVGYLRRKLAAAGVPPEAIETVRGFGYRYSPG